MMKQATPKKRKPEGKKRKSAGWGCFNEWQIRNVLYVTDHIALASEKRKSLAERYDTLLRSRIFGRRIRRLVKSVIEKDVIDGGKEAIQSVVRKVLQA